MPPKRVLARPAAHGVPLHRPAARVRQRARPKAKAAALKKLVDLSAGELASLKRVRLQDADYYHRKISVAGEVKNVQMKQGRIDLDVKISGTQDEEFLREMSGREGRMAQVHVCDSSCRQDVTGATYLHGQEFEEIQFDDVAWYTNLRETERGVPDELAALREDATRGEVPREPSPRDKKEKKRKKEADKEKDEAKDSLPKSGIPGMRPLSQVFGGTALDPDPEIRGKLLKKAKRIGKSKKKKKKKKKSGSGGESEEEDSSYDSGTSSGAGGGLFDSERKMKTIWRKYPGALTATTIAEARENLLTSAGTMWDIDTKHLPPLLTQYARAGILPQMSPSMGQECLTLTVAIDHLLQGRVSACADLLSQRVKALETLSKGAQWQVARQLELVRADNQGIIDESESYQAAKRAREEAKIKAMTTRGQGNDHSYGWEKQAKGKKGKGGNKGGRSEEAGKGKNDGKKDDKGGWQKK